MIVKKLEIHLLAQKLEVLLDRIVPTHEKIPLIQADLQKILAGYRGEKSLNFAFSFLSEKEYFILHDLRLFDGKNYFQIDILILSTKYLLILEVKNIAGELYFDTEFNQLIRIKDGIKQAFPDPLIQVKRLKKQLRDYLKLETAIPIFSLVVISSPFSFITTSDAQVLQTKQIIHSESLPFRIEQISKSIPNSLLDNKTLKTIIKKFKNKHTPLNSSILEKYHLNRKHIQNGVICTNCGHLPMTRINANWYCKKCHSKDKKGHINALIDYYYLFGNNITNKEARDFLQIDSAYLATRLIKTAASKSYPKENGRGNIYHLSIEYLKKL